MRKPRMGSTLVYVPFGAWIEAPLMRQIHFCHGVMISGAWANLLSEWCRSGADMREPRMGSTLRYVPFGAWIEASLMRRYHNKLLDERYTTLNKLREVLTLQHAVR